MKLLCFILMIANVVLFLWAYRNGELSTTATVVQAQEQIILVDEAKDTTKVKQNQ